MRNYIDRLEDDDPFNDQDNWPEIDDNIEQHE